MAAGVVVITIILISLSLFSTGEKSLNTKVTIENRLPGHPDQHPDVSPRNVVENIDPTEMIEMYNGIHDDSLVKRRQNPNPPMITGQPKEKPKPSPTSLTLISFFFIFFLFFLFFVLISISLYITLFLYILCICMSACINSTVNE